jgi:hypothetical protein
MRVWLVGFRPSLAGPRAGRIRGWLVGFRPSLAGPLAGRMRGPLCPGGFRPSLAGPRAGRMRGPRMAFGFRLCRFVELTSITSHSRRARGTPHSALLRNASFTHPRLGKVEGGVGGGGTPHRNEMPATRAAAGAEGGRVGALEACAPMPPVGPSREGFGMLGIRLRVHLPCRDEAGRVGGRADTRLCAL